MPNSDDLLTNKYIAPRTALEESVVNIWADILTLPVDKIGIHDDFFDLGGHSLLATRVISQLRPLCDKNVPLRVLFEFPTVEGLAHAISHNQLNHDDKTYINLTQEAALDSSICAAAATYPCVDTPHTLLLTGATGFVGRFLLHELLQQTSADVHCLVRGKQKQQAFERLKNSLIDNQLWQPEYDTRLHVVLGDIAQPALGLSPLMFAELAESIDAIYHNATAMHHIAPYSTLKAANVEGMQEILRLACTHHLKPVHYSSTGSIFAQDHTLPEKDRVVDEFSSIDDEQHLTSAGYTASKWVSEKIVMLAQTRGIPCCIYRFGLVTGDTQQGRYDTDQWLYRLLASCIQLGSYPIDYGMEVAPVPVDFAVKALVFLSAQKDVEQNIFHLDSPNTVDLNRFMQVYNQVFEKPLQSLPYAQWLQVLKCSVEDGEQESSASIYPLLHRDISVGDAQPQVDNSSSQTMRKSTNICCQSTLALLQQYGIYLPNIDRLLLKIYLVFIVESINSSGL